MNKELPFAELFPHLHPLDKNRNATEITEKYPFLYGWRKSFSNHYKYILENDYLNPEKLTIAINFLQLRYKEKKLLTAIPEFLDEFESPCSAGGTEEIDTGKVSLFWVFETCAFIVANEFIQNSTANGLDSLIYRCFLDAGNLKNIWNNRDKCRSANNARNSKYERAEKEMCEAWMGFPATRRNNTVMSYNWIDKNHNPLNLKESTIKSYIRKWHKTFGKK